MPLLVQGLLFALLQDAVGRGLVGPTKGEETFTPPGAGGYISIGSAIKEAIVKKHNDLRSGVTVPCTAANMRSMTWSDQLAGMAQAYALNCKYQADPGNQMPTPRGGNVTMFGENLAMSTEKFLGAENLVDFVQGWFDQIVDTDWTLAGDSVSSKQYADPISQCRLYDRNTGKCQIEGYMNVVAAASHQVGCGAFGCDKGLLGSGGTFFVCKYAPVGAHLAPGKASGAAPPYALGLPCAACPNNCSNNLCGSGPLKCTGSSCLTDTSGIGAEFCTTTTTTVLTLCNGTEAVPVGNYTGTDCNKTMEDGSFCVAICEPGYESLGAFYCSRGKLLDAAYCVDASADVRTTFRFKVAASLLLQLSSSPTIEALRRSFATALVVEESLIIVEVSWLPSSDEDSARRLRKMQQVNATTLNFLVDLEVTVPKSTSAVAMVEETALLSANTSAPYATFTATMLQDFGLDVSKIVEVLPPRSFQSVVLADKYNFTDNSTATVINRFDREGVSEGMAIGAIVAAVLGALLFVVSAYYFCKRGKFEA
jgi:hypothetical protein